MTNYDVLIELEKKHGRKKAIETLSKSLANICVNIMNRYAYENDFGFELEFSKFDIRDMQDDFVAFFNREIAEKGDHNHE